MEVSFARNDCDRWNTRQKRIDSPYFTANKEKTNRIYSWTQRRKWDDILYDGYQERKKWDGQPAPWVTSDTWVKHATWCCRLETLVECSYSYPPARTECWGKANVPVLVSAERMKSTFWAYYYWSFFEHKLRSLQSQGVPGTISRDDAIRGMEKNSAFGSVRCSEEHESWAPTNVKHGKGLGSSILRIAGRPMTSARKRGREG